MHTFKAKVKHDKGSVTLKVVAKDRETAIRMLMEAERCPRRAIQWIYAYRESDVSFL